GEIRAFTREVDPAVREGIRVAAEHILRIVGEWMGDAGA
ncbi:MAG: hydrogenase maturation protease, partial [Methanomicrobiales archaeon]|nr:hydrogenase maturation protease [Methanomicrobiales archaeon]